VVCAGYHDGLVRHLVELAVVFAGGEDVARRCREEDAPE
jgi:hypothetical protein